MQILLSDSCVVFWCLTTTAGFKVHLVELYLFNFIAATASVVQIELLVYNTVVHSVQYILYVSSSPCANTPVKS